MRLISALAIIFCWIFFCLAVGLYYETDIHLHYDTTITEVTVRLEAPTTWYHLFISIDEDRTQLGLRDVKTSEDFNVVTFSGYERDGMASSLYLGTVGEILTDEIYIDNIVVFK